jgi:hypothetical protein
MTRNGVMNNIEMSANPELVKSIPVKNPNRLVIVDSGFRISKVGIGMLAGFPPTESIVTPANALRNPTKSRNTM